MIKQLFLPIVVVAVFIAAVGIFVKKNTNFSVPTYNASPAPTSSPAPAKSVTIGTKTIKVEVASTADLRAKGLSGRSNLDTGSGMLFVFNSKGVTPAFWMKDMLISLDMIWISQGKVVKIDKNLPIPSPGTADDKLVLYAAGQPIDYVLEVNAGFADSNSISVGDSVDLSNAI